MKTRIVSPPITHDGRHSQHTGEWYKEVDPGLPALVADHFGQQIQHWNENNQKDPRPESFHRRAQPSYRKPRCRPKEIANRCGPKLGMVAYFWDPQEHETGNGADNSHSHQTADFPGAWLLE